MKTPQLFVQHFGAKEKTTITSLIIKSGSIETAMKRTATEAGVPLKYTCPKIAARGGKHKAALSAPLFRHHRPRQEHVTIPRQSGHEAQTKAELF